MNTYTFKSNLKCGGCKAMVSEVLDANDTVADWTVDLDHPDRILSVKTSMDETEVISLVKQVGFDLEPQG